MKPLTGTERKGNL